MPDLKDFPHISRFDDIPIVYAKSLIETSDPLISKASLDNLRNLIPDYKIDLNKNIDLLGIAFNAAVVNLANKNGDVMSTKTALSMYDTFGGKMLNREHKREKVIGHIVSAGLSSYGESNILYSMDVRDTKDPFNIALGSVVYRVVDREYANKIEDSTNPESPNYNKLSASWEVAMANFQIAMGSPNLKEAEIVTDPKYIEELKKHLLVYGGAGKYNNAPIYRLIGEECIALGCAITSRPAADVKGLISYQKPEEITSRATIFNSLFEKSDKTKNNSVTKDIPNMEKLEQILEKLEASLASIAKKEMKDEAIAGLHADITAEVRKANETYLAQIGEAKASKDKAEKEALEIKATLEAQTKELSETKASLAKIEAQANEKAAAELFSARMDEFDAEFDLDDEDRKTLAAEIKTLDNSAESFAAFKKKMGKLMDSKCKKSKCKAIEEGKAALDKAVADKLVELSKASQKDGKLTEKELAEKILAHVTSASVTLPNNNQEQGEQKSLKEKFKDAFNKDSIIIS